jgi:hypothetical protein
MTRPFDADRILEDWLAEGPSRLPDRVIDGIVRQLNEHQQRRPGWLPRRDRMNRMFPSLGAAAAAVVIAVVGFAYLYGGGPAPPGVSPSPSPIPSPTAAGSLIHVSERHAYTIEFPDDHWTVFEYPGEWQPDTMFDLDTAGVDAIRQLFLPEGHYRHTVVLNSQPIGAEMSLEDWAASYDELLVEEFGECLPEEISFALVDGEQARVRHFRCAGAENWADAVWVHGGRGYALRFAEDRATGAGGVEIESPPAEVTVWLSRITHSD